MYQVVLLRIGDRRLPPETRCVQSTQEGMTARKATGLTFVRRSMPAMAPPPRTAGLAESPLRQLVPAGSRLRCAMSQTAGCRLVCQPLLLPPEPESAQRKKNTHAQLRRHTKPATTFVCTFWEEYEATRTCLSFRPLTRSAPYAPVTHLTENRRAVRSVSFPVEFH